ncbi:hypothetical protein [Corynebacterium sp.]|uniref:hypothetical protein n=1 Tax=Corynebacterium sp. TaxID=1720 RepID=UPI0027B97776|nr:hypothetical protein [Corynebacterium sp.]
MRPVNHRLWLFITWLVSSLVVIPFALLIKLLTKNGGWLWLLLGLGAFIPVAFWVALSTLPFLIHRGFVFRPHLGYLFCALSFLGFLVFITSMPDAGDMPTTFYPPWCGPDTCGAFVNVGLAVSVVSHLGWVVCCVMWAVQSRRGPKTPESWDNAA